MAAFPLFTPAHFESISRELGELVAGIQLGRLFAARGISDVSAQSTKWRRINISLLARQEADRCGNNVAAFIMAVMAPGRHVGDQARYETARSALNKVLIFDGLQLGEDGQFRQVIAASTISEAKRRADGMAARLRGRDIHPEILRYCREELMQENYFHAVFEVAKSLAQRLREMTGLPLDGISLIDKGFAENQPLVWVNGLRTETKRSEHKGFALLLKWEFVAVCNPATHEPKVLWKSEDDAVDYFTLLSMLHRKLDTARAVKESLRKS